MKAVKESVCFSRTYVKNQSIVLWLCYHAVPVA